MTSNKLNSIFRVDIITSLLTSVKTFVTITWCSRTLAAVICNQISHSLEIITYKALVCALTIAASTYNMMLRNIITVMSSGQMVSKSHVLRVRMSHIER